MKTLGFECSFPADLVRFVGDWVHSISAERAAAGDAHKSQGCLESASKCTFKNNGIEPIV